MKIQTETYKRISSLRLVSHQLLATKMHTPQEIVSWMGAIQAQDYNMAKWAIGIRLKKCTNTMVESAFNNGQFLRTHVLRPTWHFVSPENIRWMLALSADKIKAASKARDRSLGITEALYSKSNQAIQKALEGIQLTRKELLTELEKAKIEVDASRMYHFMMRAELEGIVCSGALQGKTHTYALLDERVAPEKPLHKEDALAKLAQIYFNSHCPATLQDFVWWSGLSVSEAKQSLEAIKPTHIAEEINGQTYWINPAIDNLFTSVNSVYLLPAFDEYLIAYRDRQAVIHPSNNSRAISSNGIFRPVIVANGQVIGIWKKPASKNKTITLDFFETPNEFVRETITWMTDKVEFDFYE